MTAPAADHPRVDVVIPVFNGARFLEEAVRSAATQTRPPARIIIADDGSTDETPALAQQLARKLPSVEYLPLAHAGPSAARNAGILASDAPYLALLDADDVWLPQKLEKQMAVFARADGETGFVYTNYRVMDEHGVDIPGHSVVEPSLRGNIFRPLLLERSVVSGSASAVVIRRATLNKVGLFDTNLSYAEDRDLWLRLASVSQADFCPETLVRIRLNPHGIQANPSPGMNLYYFRQLMIVLGKWAHELETEYAYVAAKRQQALRLLAYEIDEFHMALKSDNSSISARLFGDRKDLVQGLMRRLSD